jgi:hypothetical protein
MNLEGGRSWQLKNTTAIKISQIYLVFRLVPFEGISIKKMYKK